MLSAAQDDQLASELLDADGKNRGAFSWALGQALLASPKNSSTRSIFLHLRALMKSKGIKQEPVLAGNNERLDQPLFGGISAEVNAHEVLVTSIDQNDVHLRVGWQPGFEKVLSSLRRLASVLLLNKR